MSSEEGLQILMVMNNYSTKALFLYTFILIIPGVSIAFSIAETLLESEAITLFVTHYPQITYLANLYPNVKNVHLKTSIDLASSPNNANNGRLISTATDGIKYLHQVGSGPCDMKSGYGQ